MTLLRASFALVKNNGAWTEFINHLAAGAAGGARNSVIVADRYGANLKIWSICGDRRENRGTLGTISHTVGSILDVASSKDLPFGGEDGRANSEVGERRVGILHHFPR